MKKPRYNFYLNPHDQYKWTKCPKCDNNTKLRKYCLMIHYKEPAHNFNQLISLNKSCKFCPSCELIIGQQPDLNELLSQIIEKFGLVFSADNYFILGTMERKDWAKNQKEPFGSEVFDLIAQFKDVWDFKIQHAGWYRESE